MKALDKPLKKPDSLEGRVQPTIRDAIVAVEGRRMMYDVHFWPKNNAALLQRLHPARRCFHVSPFMNLVGEKNKNKKRKTEVRKIKRNRPKD